MKKYISILLCLSLVIGLASPMRVFAADYVGNAGSVVVGAQKILTELDVTKPITKDTWGDATIHVDKNSVNTTLASWNGQTVEDVEMDLYFRWDEDYLYVGVVSEDNNYSKTYLGAYDGGDGIEIKINVGASRTNLRKHIKIKYSDVLDTSISFVDEDTEKVNQAAKDYGYVSKVQHVDGNMHVAIKIPFADLELSASDVKAGLAFSYSMLRVSASKNYNDDGYEGYINITGNKNDGINPGVLDGWLSWGSFFDLQKDNEPAKKAVNVNCTTDNIVVLTDEVAQTGTVVKADRAYNKVDLKDITSWGTPTIHVDKNTYNATLHACDGVTVEDMYMDIYTMWDDKNLYIGVASKDEDLKGNNVEYKGDGIQFRLTPGTELGTKYRDIYVTFDTTDGMKVQIGSNNSEEYTYDYSLTYDEESKMMYVAVAVPFSNLNMEEDAKAGTLLAFDIIRISGTTVSAGDYAGWLAYGTLWGANSPNTENCVGDNVIVLSDNVATNATTIVADKATSRIDLNDIKSWGKPAISVDKNSYNATLDGHVEDDDTVSVPEDVSMDIYTKWDDKNLYIGVVSPDTDVMGSDESWKGDGIQFKISTGTILSDTANQNIYFSINKDNVTASIGDTTYSYALKVENDVMYAAVAVPFEKLGMSNLDIKAGATFAIDLIRISATGSNENQYAGWLAWGPFFDAPYCQSCVGDNVIVLVNSNAVNVPENSGTSEEFKSLLTAIDTEAGQFILNSAIGSDFGDSAEHKMITTKNGTYVLYITRNVTCGDKTVVNEFTLVKINGDEFEEVAYSYTYDSLVDMVADKDGNIYIVSGSSSTTWNKIRNSNDAEKAILNIFKYDETTKALNGQKVYRAFTNTAKEHKYLGSAVDTTNGKIYTAYIGIDADGKYTDVEYFTYDVATAKYAKESTAYTVSLDKITNSAVFALNDGMGFVCSNGTEVSYFNANGTKTTVTQAVLADVYANADGSVKLLCGNKLEIVTINADGTVADTKIESTVSAEGQTFRFVEVGEELYVIAMDTENAAQVNIYKASDLSLVSTTKLDKVIVYSSSFMAALDLTSSTDNITVMFAGKRGSVTHWYCATVPMPDAE